MSDKLFKILAPAFAAVGYLNVQPMKPSDYQAPYSLVSDKATMRIFGSFAAAAETKHPTWRLNYGTVSLPGVAIYLDGVTGEILYIHDISEG